MVSPAVFIVRESDPNAGQAPGAEFSITARSGDFLRAGSGSTQVRLQIEDPPDDTQAPDLPGFRLISGSSEVIVDPEEGKSPSLEIRLVDSQGQPVPLEMVAWRFDEPAASVHPVTVTDEQGYARLSFLPTPGGKFQPVYDGIPLGQEINPGTVRVTAIPVDPLLVAQLDTKFPTFQATLNYP